MAINLMTVCDKEWFKILRFWFTMAVVEVPELTCLAVYSGVALSAATYVPIGQIYTRLAPGWATGRRSTFVDF